MAKEAKETYYEVDSSTEELFLEVFNKKSFPVNVRFLFQGNSKQKQLIKVTKIPDQYAFSLCKELLISINEDLLNVFDNESITILVEQEIDKININMESGKIKLVGTDLNTFSSIVNKWGVEKVARANKVEELYHEQKIDAKSDEEFII
jgi:hypothetical protein